jgi:anti-sigma B factor antagonist
MDSAMKIDIRTINDVKILDCSGPLTLGEGTMAVRNAVRDTLQGGGIKIIFNLANVTYIDSPGVGELVVTYTTLKAQGGWMKLLNPTRKIQLPLVVTNLATVFEMSDNEQALLASFASPAIQGMAVAPVTNPLNRKASVA